MSTFLTKKSSIEDMSPIEHQVPPILNSRYAPVQGQDSKVTGENRINPTTARPMVRQEDQQDEILGASGPLSLNELKG